MPELKRIRLWIEVDVNPTELLTAAGEMYAACWSGDEDDPVGEITRLAGERLAPEVQAFFEAILGSTPGPHPDWLYCEGDGIDYGGEIVRTFHEDWDAD